MLDTIDANIRARHRGARFRLLQGDCIEILGRLPPQTFDLIAADPPYNLSNGGTTCQAGKRVKVDKAAWDESRGFAEDHKFNTQWIAACERVLKPSGTLWAFGTKANIFSLGFALQSTGWNVLNIVSWYKPNASPNLACRTPTHSTELVLWAAPPSAAASGKLLHTYNYREMKAENGGKQLRDVWPIREDGEADDAVLWEMGSARGDEKREGKHPTQKPLALLDRIIRASSKPGDLVLDPFNGAGTTGRAATKAGRFYVGIDLDPRYLDLTARRLALP